MWKVAITPVLCFCRSAFGWLNTTGVNDLRQTGIKVHSLSAIVSQSMDSIFTDWTTSSASPASSSPSPASSSRRPGPEPTPIPGGLTAA